MPTGRHLIIAQKQLFDFYSQVVANFSRVKGFRVGSHRLYVRAIDNIFQPILRNENCLHFGCLQYTYKMSVFERKVIELKFAPH